MMLGVIALSWNLHEDGNWWPYLTLDAPAHCYVSREFYQILRHIEGPLRIHISKAIGIYPRTIKKELGHIFNDGIDKTKG